MSSSFLDIQLPTDISYGAVGGPEFSTNINITKGKVESRNFNWSSPRHKYNIAYGLKNPPLCSQSSLYI